MSELILDSIFYYAGMTKILKGCYLKVKSGHVTGLVGQNGTGKSTLIKIVAGQIQADQGLTIINETRFHKKSKRKRFGHLAYLPQQSFIPREVKVAKIISGALENDEMLTPLKNAKVKDLSTGERRYLEITLVLSLKRDFVLLDEPFTGLSPIQIERISERIKQKKKEGTGFLISDHYAHYMLGLADKFYIMKNGEAQKISGESDPRTLLIEAGYFSR